MQTGSNNVWHRITITTAALLLLMALGSPSICSAEKWAEDMFNSLEFDFENLARGAKAEHRFTIKNKYKEDVHITSISSSCGCTEPRVEKRTLKSLETTDLIAKFNTVGYDGPRNATVTVTFDKPYYAEVRLKIKGQVRKDVVFTPGVVDLGTVDVGSETEKKVTVAYAGRDDWKVIDVRSVNTNLEVELNPKTRASGRVTYELLVRLKDSAPAGYIRDQLTLITNDTKGTKIPLEVQGHVKPTITVSPASLQLGQVQPGGEVKKLLVVTGKKPFKIANVTCPDKCFKFKPSGDTKRVHRIPVTFVAGEDEGKIVEKIKVEVEGSSEELPVVVAHVVVRALDTGE